MTRATVGTVGSGRASAAGSRVATESAAFESTPPRTTSSPDGALRPRTTTGTTGPAAQRLATPLLTPPSSGGTAVSSTRPWLAVTAYGVATPRTLLGHGGTTA